MKNKCRQIMTKITKMRVLGLGIYIYIESECVMSDKIMKLLFEIC